MFDFDSSDELKILIRKLSKKNATRAAILNNKIKEIINNDATSIDRYKNCKYDLKVCKRVHIDKSFVMVFSVDENKKLVIIEDYDHHDNIYK